MTRFQIEIREQLWRDLDELAMAERRPTKDHAAWLLEQMIRQEMAKKSIDPLFEA